MTEYIFHPATKRHLDAYVDRPAHALILSGPDGIGKTSLSRWIAVQVLQFDDEVALNKYPHFKVVEPDGQSISIDAMRELAKFAKLKIPTNTSSTKRIIIIEQTNLMTVEAQNALLKLLEEPPDNTILILNTSNMSTLLPTIRSRAQSISVQIPEFDAINKYFLNQNFLSSKINQAYLMSGGLPGLMTALLNQQGDHPLVKAATTARQILQMDTFARLSMVDGLAKNKLELSQVIFMLKQMAQAALEQGAKKDSAKSVVTWHKIHRAAYNAGSQIAMNAQAKLVISNLMLQI